MDSDNPATGIILTVVVLSIIFYTKKDELLTGFRLITVFYVLGGIVAFVVIILICILGYKQRLKKKMERESQKDFLKYIEKELNSRLKINFQYYSSEKALVEIEEIKFYIKTLPAEIASKYNFQDYYNQWDDLVTYLKENEALQEQKRLEAIREQQWQEEQTKREALELFEFKKKNQSMQALLINSHYSNKVIRKAEEYFDSYLFKQKRNRVMREEAIEYYSKNSLESKPKLYPNEEEIYAKVRKEIQEGLVVLKKIPCFSEKVTIKGNFYRAKDLDEETKKRALEEGFVHMRGIELDGQLCGGGFYRNLAGCKAPPFRALNFCPENSSK